MKPTSAALGAGGTPPATVDDVDWATWSYTDDAVLCFIRDGDRLWLIRKKRGLGAGKINAPGGRIEPGEEAPAAAVRETLEETGLTPSGLEYVCELNFIFVDGYSLRGFVYFADSYSGNPMETPEADPFWCRISELPYDQMWADDVLWLPRVLAGERVLGRFIFDGDEMLSQRLLPLPE